MLSAIKVYATLCLISTALFGWIGYRHNKRRERFDADWAAISEPPPIKAEPTIWS